MASDTARSRVRRFAIATAGVAAGAAGVARRRRVARRGPVRTLRHLVGVTRDAEIGARLGVDLFAYDAETATFLNDVATEAHACGRELTSLLSSTDGTPEAPSGGTALGRLFHWRLRLARRVRLGNREIDDHRINLRMVGTGLRRVVAAYRRAGRDDLDAEARRLLHQQEARFAAAAVTARSLSHKARYADR